MRSIGIGLFAGALITIGLFGSSQAQNKPIPKMPAETLKEPEIIKTGAAIWEEQCRHCHGRDAYPGKAPKLNPGKYSPEFVYHRVTYGFRGMPPWEEIYSEEERIGVVAYILSPEFSP